MQDEKNTVDSSIVTPESVEPFKPAKVATTLKRPVTKKKEIMVMGRTCYLREYPSVTSNRVITYPMISSGEEVEVVSHTTNEEEWCKVKAHGAIGYCKAMYLIPKRE